MSLDIGTLTGYVDLDDSPATKAVSSIGGMLEKAGGVWGKTLAAAGAAGGALFGTSLAGAMNLEAGQDRVAAALDLTAKQSETVGKVAGSLFANAWGENAEEVNGAVEAVMSSISGMRDASAADLEDMTQRAMTLSTAMQVDVVRAAQVAGNMLTNGLAKDGKQAFDLLTKAMSKVPVQLREDVMDATDEYGQFFNQLGIKGPKAMGILAKGAEKGMYGIDKAGDAIKEFTIRSTDMSKTSTDAYKAIGLDAEKMTQAFLKGGPAARGALDKVIDGLLKIKDPAARANQSIALFGVPLEDLSTRDIPKFLKSLKSGNAELGNWKGANDRAGKSLNDNAKTNLTGFTRKLQTAFINTLGGKVLPKITEWSATMDQQVGPALEQVGRTIGKLTDFLSRHMTAVKVVAAVIVALLLPNYILLGLAAIKAGIMQVRAWVMTQASAIKSVAVFVAAKVAMVAGWVLMGAQALLGAAKVAAAWLIALGPIGLVIAAVVGIVVLIVKNWDLIKEVTAKAWGWVVGKITSTWSAITGAVSSGVSSVLGFLKRNWPIILAILTGPIGLAVLAIAKNWDKIKSGAGSVVDWIRGIPGKIGALGSKFGEAGRKLLQGFIDGMKNAAGIISGIAGNVWNAVRGLLNGAIAKINAALEFNIDLPLGKSVGINPPDIPQLATGGRATSATLAIIGEGREAETVLPDSKLFGLMGRAHEAGRRSAMEGQGRQAPLIGVVNQQPGEDANTLAEKLWHKTRTRG